MWHLSATSEGGRDVILCGRQEHLKYFLECHISWEMPLIRFGCFHTSSPDWEWAAQLGASKEYLLCLVNRQKSCSVFFILKNTWLGLQYSQLVPLYLL